MSKIVRIRRVIIMEEDVDLVSYSLMTEAEVIEHEYNLNAEDIIEQVENVDAVNLQFINDISIVEI